MSEINFNNSTEYVNEFKVFNNGIAGIVEPVQIRIEKKKPEDGEKFPDYKLIGFNESGEVNMGFYYYENAEENGFKNFQAQKLIMLAKGVMGDDVKFPAFNTPREALDQIMLMVAKASKGKHYRIACTYGSTKRPEQYLGFKAFGRFIQPVEETSNLNLDPTDNTVRAQRTNTPNSNEEIQSLISDVNPPNNVTDDLPF